MVRCIRAACAMVGLMALLTGCAGEVSPEALQLLRQAHHASAQGDHAVVIRNTSVVLRDRANRSRWAEALYLRAMAYQGRDQNDLARADLAEAADRAGLAETRVKIQLALGDQQAERGQYRQARDHYRQALAEIPRDDPLAAQAQYRLADLLQRTGEFDQADIHFGKVGYLYPDSPLAPLARSRSRARAWSIHLGSWARRDRADRQAAGLQQVGLDPTVAVALGQRGPVFRVLQGRFATRDQAQRALDALPHRPRGARVVVVR